MSQAYEDIARKLSLPGWDDPKVDFFRLVSESLSKDSYGSWLIVLDNADDEDTFFSKKTDPSVVNHLPRSSKGYILITTRDRRVGERLAGGEKAIDVEPMANLEAEQLLQSKVAEARRFDQTKRRDLLKLLGCLPLAISQAAAYISENNITIEEYLETLSEEAFGIQDLLDQDLPDLRRDSRSQNSVIRTWKVSFDQIRRQKPRAAEILSLMAVLDRQGIPEFLLRGERERTVEFQTALGTLQAFSLISKEVGGKSFEIHQLVQMATREWLEREGHLARWQEESRKALSAVFPSGRYETPERCELLSSHIETVIRYTLDSDSNQLQWADLLQKVSRYYWETRGQYSLAFERGWDALSIRKSMLDPEHLDILSSTSDCAVILERRGQYKTAEEMCQQILKLYKKKLGSEHPGTLCSMNNLALVLYKQNKCEVAEEMYQEALTLCKKVLGSEHPHTLCSLNNLALVLDKQNKCEVAEEMHQEALTLCKKVLGSEHPDTLCSMNNLALVLDKQNKCEVAEEIHQEALTLCKKVLGSDVTTQEEHSLYILTESSRQDTGRKYQTA